MDKMQFLAHINVCILEGAHSAIPQIKTFAINNSETIISTWVF
jgi:hypothetical protein